MSEHDTTASKSSTDQSLRAYPTSAPGAHTTTSTTGKRPPTAADLIATHLDLEILVCADTGRTELIATTNDFTNQQVIPDEALALIGAARLQLDRAEALVARYRDIADPSPEQQLQDLLASLCADLVEETPGNPLPEGVAVIWYAEPGETPTFIFPAGMDPATRLTVARDLIAHLAVTT